MTNVRLFPPVEMGEFISALAAGRPVLIVGPRESELAKMVQANDCGTAVTIDGDALAEAVRHLRAHPENARAQSDRGRSLCERLVDREKAFASSWWS